MAEDYISPVTSFHSSHWLHLYSFNNCKVLVPIPIIKDLQLFLFLRLCYPFLLPPVLHSSGSSTPLDHWSFCASPTLFCSFTFSPTFCATTPTPSSKFATKVHSVLYCPFLDQWSLSSNEMMILYPE